MERCLIGGNKQTSDGYPAQISVYGIRLDLSTPSKEEGIPSAEGHRSARGGQCARNSALEREIEVEWKTQE